MPDTSPQQRLGQKSMSFNPLRDPFDDPDLGILYEYWALQRGTRSMPCRADINPRDIAAVMPLVFIADIFQPMRFRSALWARPSVIAGMKI